MRFTELRNELLAAWKCSRKVATLATRYYRGIDTAEQLTATRYYHKNPVPPLLTDEEMWEIKRCR